MEILAGFGNGLLVALQPENLLYCFVGVFLGTFIGVLPGIGSMAAISMRLSICAGDFWIRHPETCEYITNWHWHWRRRARRMPRLPSVAKPLPGTAGIVTSG